MSDAQSSLAQLEERAELLKALFLAEMMPMVITAVNSTFKEYKLVDDQGYCYDERHRNLIPWKVSNVTVPESFILIRPVGIEKSPDLADAQLRRVIDLMGKNKLISAANDGRPPLCMGVIFILDATRHIAHIMMSLAAFNGDKVLPENIRSRLLGASLPSTIKKDKQCRLLDKFSDDDLPPPSYWSDASLRLILNRRAYRQKVPTR
jgi:hypothetical protein